MWLAEACSRDAGIFINWILIAIPIGIVTGIISSIKGKGFWQGFFIGALFLIVGFLIVACPDKENK